MPDLMFLMGATVVIVGGLCFSHRLIDMENRTDRWLYRAAMLNGALGIIPLTSLWLKWAG
ncbi:MAG: hypothetical protein K2Q10_02800 [Rhodospirillales bacterium]|nr:hypothetical protein [Rhodospirillales bacterium]